MEIKGNEMKRNECNILMGDSKIKPSIKWTLRQNFNLIKKIEYKV